MRRTRILVVVALVLLLVPFVGRSEAAPPKAPAKASVASGFLTYKFPLPQPLCVGVGLNTEPSFAFDRSECGFVSFAVSPAPPASPTAGKAKLYKPGTEEVFAQPDVLYDAQDGGQFEISPTAAWPAGLIRYEVFIGSETVPAGGGVFRHNFLGATVAIAPKADGSTYRPGESLPISGQLYQLKTLAITEQQTPVAATYSLRISTAKGTRTIGPFTANSGGAGGIAATVPGDATAGLAGAAENQFRTTVTVEVVNASYQDASTGAWASQSAGELPVELAAPPITPVVDNSYVSAVGWVKPGEDYPFRLLVKNFSTAAASGAVVTVPRVAGTTFTKAAPAGNAGTASILPDGSIRWQVGAIAPGGSGGPSIKTLVVEARAATTAADPQIVWKNLSSTATLAYSGGPAGLTSTSKGPKVIPPGEAYETARYGLRPFAVVPVDFNDRKHDPSHSGSRLATVINSPDFPGSTYNLYQEMSLGQLFPNGTVPSAGIAHADFSYAPGFDFTELDIQGACRGVTVGSAAGTVLYPNRIVDGWYQLPGTTDYYGDDTLANGYTAQVGQRLGDNDSACGPGAKAVYDAASIADPEIDYSDYDTDKDGVVDFFMMVGVGVGGNGASQFEIPPYDNIWPHSSSLEFTYSSPEGDGYVSDDQLKDLEGRPLFWTDGARTAKTTKATNFPVRVRVGPYNVNPETALDHASVISHEYGHSLGLPDFYSGGSRTTYGDWTLMAQDKSQNMDIFGKQELGWIIPRVLTAGQTTARGWRDSKVNTHRIDWVQPDGKPYTLSGPGVNNAEAYVAKLPGRKLIDASVISSGASPSHVWWSTAGDAFNCPVDKKSKTLDVYLPELKGVAAGSAIEASFASLWNTEWDFDYGYVMMSTDGGKTFGSLPSKNGYTTPASQNPQASSCQAKLGNGITGSSGSYAAGTEAIDRTGLGETTGLLDPYPTPVFLADAYDLSAAAGKDTVLRFAYYTDAGVSRPGWFVDNLKVTAGNNVIYKTDFESAIDARLFPGGCRENVQIVAVCTRPWLRISASEPSTFDHAYYLEMRDRSGFDFDGHGQSEATPIGFGPGTLLVYTDEAHGYGNVGTTNPPAQTPLDSTPSALSDTPNLDDAAYIANAGRNRFTDSGEGHVDNYTNEQGGPWAFKYGCLTFEVLRMTGTASNSSGARDLEGDVRFDMGAGCAKFDYGYGVLAATGEAAQPTVPPPVVAKGKLPRTGGGATPALVAFALLLAAVATRRVRQRSQ